MITTLIALGTWVVSHAWALALIALPAILGFLQPILSGLVDGLKAYLSTVWEGLKSMDFKEMACCSHRCFSHRCCWLQDWMGSRYSMGTRTLSMDCQESGSLLVEVLVILWIRGQHCLTYT